MNVMKKVISTAIALAWIFTALPGNAEVDPTLRNLKDGKTTVLTVSGVEEGDSIFIKDLFGEVLYEQSVSSSGVYKRTFNLTSYEEGSYYFEVTMDDQHRRLPFRVVNHKIVLKKHSEAAITRQVKRMNKKSLKIQKRSAARKARIPVEQRTPSFKGRDFANYYKKTSF